MAISSLVAALNSLFGQYFFVEGKYKLCLLINFVWALIYVSLILFFKVELTAKLVANILLASYVLLLIFQFFLSRIYLVRKNKCS
jgi:uncharacterized membrane protein (DUF485 family)